MQLIVKGRLEDQLTEVLGKLRPKGSDNPPIMVFVDPKCTRNLSDYRSVPIAEPQLYKVLSKVFFENEAMQDRDVLVLMDGRSARNGNNIRSLISEGKESQGLRPPWRRPAPSVLTPTKSSVSQTRTLCVCASPRRSSMLVFRIRWRPSMWWGGLSATRVFRAVSAQWIDVAWQQRKPMMVWLASSQRGLQHCLTRNQETDLW